MKRGVSAVAFVSGLVFSIGLGIAGMGRPAKVLAFLDVTGAWDPSLAFVMAGAIAVHAGFALRARRGGTPLFAASYAFPMRDSLHLSLFAGASIFGIGWGLVGYCPGPAVLGAASASSTPLIFLAAMMVGLSLQRVLGVMLPTLSRSGREALDLAE